MLKYLKIVICCICIVVFFGMSMPNNNYITADEIDKQVCMPVIMYHNILKSRKSSYIVSPNQLENDLIALKKEGYTAVLPSEVINFVKGTGQLPQKPILISFDDGHYNNYHYAYPLFKKHDMKGVINIIGAFTEFTTKSGDISNPNYSHLTWQQIEELSKSGYFEIGNHSYNMHKFKPRYGIAQAKGESIAEYEKALKDDILATQTLLKQNSNIDCKIFAYPFGKYEKSSEQLLKNMGFEMIFTCTNGINTIKQGKPETLLRLKRYNRNGSWSTKRLISVLKSACE